jgi:hypothetical protein
LVNHADQSLFQFNRHLRALRAFYSPVLEGGPRHGLSLVIGGKAIHMKSLALGNAHRFGSLHLRALVQGFSDNRLIYACALFCILAHVIQSTVLGVTSDLKMVGLFSLPIALILVAFIVVGLLREMHRLNRVKYEGPILPALGRKLSDDYFAPQRLSNAVHFMVCITTFMTGFTALKSAIPQINPFSWDPYFVDLDRMLHFGAQPYEWLAPVLNFQFVTLALNINYNLWFFVMFGFCFWHGFARQNNRLRQHFLVAFMMTWFLGTVASGTLLSSVGPAFYGRLYPGQFDPYAPLMAWLNHVNESHSVFALGIMDELWASYIQGQGSISGISAMPSMHVGSSILFILCALATGKRWLAWTTTVFALAIFVGSIHLGWHYAVDGYLGAAIAQVCWWLAARIVNWDRTARGVA